MQPNTATLAGQQYVIRRKVFKLFGGAFHIYDMAGRVVLYSQMKAFKLKEDIRLFTGEDMRQELLRIRARQIIDFSAAYDVFDPVSNEKVGAFKRKGWKSMIKDEWVMMDAQDREIALIKEDSTLLALLRRFADYVSLFLPQKYHLEIGGQLAATYKQHFNPFVFRMTMDFGPDTQGRLDRRMGIAAAVLLVAIEGRQT